MTNRIDRLLDRSAARLEAARKDLAAATKRHEEAMKEIRQLETPVELHRGYGAFCLADGVNVTAPSYAERMADPVLAAKEGRSCTGAAPQG